MAGKFEGHGTTNPELQVPGKAGSDQTPQAPRAPNQQAIDPQSSCSPFQRLEHRRPKSSSISAQVVKRLKPKDKGVARWERPV